MSHRFSTGLVVGKFAPLHAGHMRVVECARAQCETVVVLSYSNPEPPRCGPELRDQWLETCFPDAVRLVVTEERLASWLSADCAPPTVPLNTAPADTHRDFVAMLCERVLRRRVDAVFTSEAYGDGFAAHLTRRFRDIDPAAPLVTHVSVDPERCIVPVSSTLVRRDPMTYWRFLPAPVARSLARRIAFLGGESSGKTVLASAMAREFGIECVAEYGRELWVAKNGRLDFDDMVQIAREQIRREEAAIARSPLAFCDTTPLTTLFYSVEMFGSAAAELGDLSGRRYDEVVLCAPDFPFVQDGTRRDDGFRMRQDAWYRSQLKSRGITYLTVRGGLDARVRELRELVDAFWIDRQFETEPSVG
jgi:HTH-type transcriptional repressor of NAD biosynthesis genes